MAETIKKAILPIAGLGTRFLPLSKVLPKELWPLVDRPVLDYILEEIKSAGIREIVFVISPEKKMVLDYFRRRPEIEKILIRSGRTKLLKAMRDYDRQWQNLKISHVFQKKPLGDGHAILQTKSKAKKETVAVSFGDDLIFSKVSCLTQLMKVFQKVKAPVIALKKLPRRKVSAYGVVKARKIAPRTWRIEDIVEKPTQNKAPSNLVAVGKYVITPEVYQYLATAKPGLKGEIILAETFKKMIGDGKMIYGYEVEGDWLECGDLNKWILSSCWLAKKQGKVF